MDLVWLAATGASALVSAMATDAWGWARSELSGLFTRAEPAREQAENARLESFAEDLETTAEREVQIRLSGFLEARLSDAPDMGEAFLDLVTQVCAKIGLEPPTVWTNQLVNVTVANGAHAQVYVGAPSRPPIIWAAMTATEAAHRLEAMEPSIATKELARMDLASAARRLSYVNVGRAAGLLSHMDEQLAADLLSRMAPGRAAELLAKMEARQGAVVLERMDPDWAVKRLMQMDPERALLLLAALGSKRTDNLLEAMERQQAVILLGAIGKVLADQARIRTTFDLAEQEAERIVSEARKERQNIIDQARAEATALTEAAHTVPEEEQPGTQIDRRSEMENRVLGLLGGRPGKLFTPRDVARMAGLDTSEASSVLFGLANAGFITHHPRSNRYCAR